MPELHLPAPLLSALWAHARQAAPHECVGALGGQWHGESAHASALYPLVNIAADPQREYLADPGELLRALRAMKRGAQELVGLYHSHPVGPAWPSRSDTRLAAYPVPYLIADLRGQRLQAYLLPAGTAVRLHLGGAGAPRPTASAEE
ncbi:M67 family metallopeptidase [Deinococcus navajonensis]|uniref:M67 family metallopeptidase n=1 Tax=Deinococcus navajonensis TaxID=309884 RepID=A0ABV8XMM4_9DEIO